MLNAITKPSLLTIRKYSFGLGTVQMAIFYQILTSKLIYKLSKSPKTQIMEGNKILFKRCQEVGIINLKQKTYVKKNSKDSGMFNSTFLLN